MNPTNSETEIGLFARLGFILFGVISLFGLPYLSFIWFAHDYLPFLPGSASANGTLIEKYALQRYGRKTSERTGFSKETTHALYQLDVGGRLIEGRAQVSTAFFDELKEGEVIEVYYCPWHAKFNHPAKDSPGVLGWLRFALAFLVTILIAPFGGFIAYFGLVQKSKSSLK